MTIPDGQFAQLLTALNRIADRQFTISEAADWPLAIILLGALGILVGLMWKDMKAAIAGLQNSMIDQRKETKDDVAVVEKQLAELWRVLRMCQQRHAVRKISQEDAHE